MCRSVLLGPLCRGTAALLPDEVQDALAVRRFDAPFHQDHATGPRQGAVFDCIGHKLMQHQTKGRSEIDRQYEWLAFHTIAKGVFEGIRRDQLAHEFRQIGAFPVRIAQQTVCACQGFKPALKARNEFFGGGMRAHRLMSDRPSNGKRIFQAVPEVALKHALAFLPRFPISDVADALECKLPTVESFELHDSLDRQNSSVLRPIQELAAPKSFLTQLGRHFCEGGSRHLGLQKLFLASANSLLARIAVQFLAAAIPFEDTAVEFPYENWCSRKLDKAFLAKQLAFAFAQRLLHMTPLCNIDECDDDTVDLVIDGTVRTHAHVVPKIVATTDFLPYRHQVGQHFPGVQDQFVIFELMGEITDRPTFVVWRDAEQIGRPLGEALYAQSGIEKQRAEIGRCQKVLQVAVSARNRLQLQLQLGVDGLQLLVDRLKFLLAGFQFL